MATPKRILVGCLAVISGLAYVWFAAVRAVPGIKGRKEAVRRSRT